MLEFKQQKPCFTPAFIVAADGSPKTDNEEFAAKINSRSSVSIRQFVTMSNPVQFNLSRKFFCTLNKIPLYGETSIVQYFPIQLQNRKYSSPNNKQYILGHLTKGKLGSVSPLSYE